MEYRDELKLVIQAEIDKTLRDLKRYNTSAEKAEHQTYAVSKAVRMAKTALATAGIGMSLTFIARKAGDFAEAQAEAEEATAKFLTVFRDLQDEALDASSSYAKAFNTAESTAMKMLGNVGDLLTGMGATQEQALGLAESVSELGTDLASFANYAGGASGAVEALTKMMLGEREMVKSLGIVIREADVQQKLLEKGQQKLTGQAKLLATAQASLELAMEQSKNAIGDYERTSESTANVNRRLSESFKEVQENAGYFINRVLTPLKSDLADILDSINDVFSASSHQGPEQRDPREMLIEQYGKQIDQLQQKTYDNLKTLREYSSELQTIINTPLKSAENWWESYTLEDKLAEASRLLEDFYTEWAGENRTIELTSMGDLQKQFLALTQWKRQAQNANPFAEEIETLEAKIASLKDELAEDQKPAAIDTAAAALSEANAALEAHLGELTQVQEAYQAAGIEMDLFAGMQGEVIKQLEGLATAEGVTRDAMDGFIDRWQEFLHQPAGDEAAFFPDKISQLEDQLQGISELEAAYRETGLTFDGFSQKQESVIAAFEEIATSEEISREQLALFIDRYREFLEVEAPSQWREFSESLEKELEGMLFSLASSLMTGEAGLEGLVQTSISSITQEAAKSFGSAFTGAGSLINFAGGALAGLASVVFSTASAIEHAQEVLDEAQSDVKDLFLDVLDIEEEAASTRIEAIEEEMSLLTENRDLRLEILRDKWKSGDITGVEYFEQASRINQEYRDQEQAYDNQEQMITTLQDVIKTLDIELDDMSGWTKFWTSKDSDLENSLATYKQLLAEISEDPDGLTDAEIQELAAAYNIDVPKAAEGAEFVTRGPQLVQVGDNPGGEELVQVTPLSSPNIHGPLPSGDIHIHVEGPVFGVDDLYLQLDQAGKRLKKLGRLGA